MTWNNTWAAWPSDEEKAGQAASFDQMRNEQALRLGLPMSGASARKKAQLDALNASNLSMIPGIGKWLLSPDESMLPEGVDYSVIAARLR